MARETSKTGALTIGLVMVVAVFGCGPPESLSMATENCTLLATENCTRRGESCRAERTFSR